MKTIRCTRSFRSQRTSNALSSQYLVSTIVHRSQLGLMPLTHSAKASLAIRGKTGIPGWRLKTFRSNCTTICLLMSLVIWQTICCIAQIMYYIFICCPRSIFIFDLHIAYADMFIEHPYTCMCHHSTMHMWEL